VYGIGLVLTACAYLLFGLGRGAPPAYVAVEAVGATLYTAAAVAGVGRWPFALALGWTGHVAWDLVRHHAGGPAFAPPWYPPLCVGFDLFLGGYIAGAVAQATEDRPPPPQTSSQHPGSSSVLVNQGWTMPCSVRRSHRPQRPKGFSRHTAVGRSRGTPIDALGGGSTSCPRPGRPSPGASKPRA
jgi:hypothetical protein